MIRTVIGNAKVVRTMIDEDINGIISGEEIELLIEDINESLGGMDHFEEEFIFAGVPFNAEIDEIDTYISNSSVEITGLTNGSSVNSYSPITITINGIL